MERSIWVSVTPSPSQNKINNILKLTYFQIISQINSFTFIIHINITTVGRIRQASVTTLQIRKEINNIINSYKNNRSLSTEEVTRAKLNSYYQWNHHYQNKKDNLDYNKILLLRRKQRQLIICHDTYPNDANENYEHPNDIKTLILKKKW